MASKTTGALAATASATASAAPAVTVETTRSAVGKLGRPGSGLHLAGPAPGPGPPADRPWPAYAPHGHLLGPQLGHRQDGGPGRRPGAQDRHPADRVRGRPAHGPDQAADVGVVDAIPLVAEDQRVARPGALGDRVDLAEVQHCDLERHGHAQPPPGRVQAGDEFGQARFRHLVSAVAPVQAQFGVRGPMQHR